MYQEISSQHLAKLTEGVKVWNNWRREYQDIIPDLRDANLRGATVRWVTLRGAKNLTVQQLCKALTLYEAELDQDHQELILRDHSHLLEDPDKSI